MPYPLNNVASQDNYVDAATCVLPRPTTSMNVQVYNASVCYRLLLVPRDQLQVGAFTVDVAEHFLGPCFAGFDEGDLPAGQSFAGIQFRSYVAGVPGNVTVI